MKATHGNILIKASGVYNHFVKHGNLTLYVDPLFKPGQRRIIHGEVVSIPDGIPDYMEIVPEVQVGDKLYFHYNALDADNLIPDSGGVYSIIYDMVLCAIRNGKLIPLAGKIFCSKVYDEDVVDLKIEGEIKKCRVSSAGIITEINCKYSEKIARLEHIGTPRPGRKVPTVQVGDKVVYIKDGDFINQIEGQEYFVMNQEDILATV